MINRATVFSLLRASVFVGLAGASAAAAAQSVPIIQPGAPGQAPRALSPQEAQLAALLLERPGDVVPYAALDRLGDGPVAKGHSARRMLVLRLRRHLAHLGLVIRTERGLGYVLEVPADGSSVAS